MTCRPTSVSDNVTTRRSLSLRSRFTNPRRSSLSTTVVILPSLLRIFSAICPRESGLAPERLTELVIDPTEPALFQLSGGTTGIPKLIPRTHNDYIYNTKAAVAVNDIRPDDSFLVVLPMAHNFPLACPGIQGFLYRGARFVIGDSTRPTDVFPLIERERITHLELVPAVLIRWINDPHIQEYDLSSL